MPDQINPVDAIGMALTPGTIFNQGGNIWRSASALGQFAALGSREVLALIVAHLSDKVTIRPSAKNPQNGPLIALTEFIPDDLVDGEGVVQVKIMGGNAVAPDPAPAAALSKIVENAGQVGGDPIKVNEVGPALAGLAIQGPQE